MLASGKVRASGSVSVEVGVSVSIVVGVSCRRGKYVTLATTLGYSWS